MKKKQLLSLLLAIVMALGLALPAGAQTERVIYDLLIYCDNWTQDQPVSDFQFRLGEDSQGRQFVNSITARFTRETDDGEERIDCIGHCDGTLTLYLTLMEGTTLWDNPLILLNGRPFDDVALGHVTEPIPADLVLTVDFPATGDVYYDSTTMRGLQAGNRLSDVYCLSAYNSPAIISEVSIMHDNQALDQVGPDEKLVAGEPYIMAVSAVPRHHNEDIAWGFSLDLDFPYAESFSEFNGGNFDSWYNCNCFANLYRVTLPQTHTVTYDDEYIRIWGLVFDDNKAQPLEKLTILYDHPQRKFDHWEIEGLELSEQDKGSNSLTITMPDNPITIRAVSIAEEPPFTDVNPDAYYGKAVDWAVMMGVADGLTETTFGPDKICTRAQGITFLYRAALPPTPEGKNPFTDVDQWDYFYSPVCWGCENEIINGISPTAFGPGQPLTRAQFVTMLFRLGGEFVEGVPENFTDVSVSDYFYSAVMWAVSSGITTGTSPTTFDPHAPCTRAEAVTFLYRFMQNRR